MSRKMEIVTTKTVFKPFESVDGTINLQLDEPTKANGLYLKMYSYEYHGGGVSIGPGYKRISRSRSSMKIWASETLDSGKVYPAYRELIYPFKFTAPALSDPHTSFTDLWRTLRKDSSPKDHGTKDFWIEAKLDVGWMRNISSVKPIKVFYID